MPRNAVSSFSRLLAIFPLSELALQIVNVLVVSLLPPEPLPKMDFRDGIPAGGRNPDRGPHDALEPSRSCARNWRSWKCAISGNRRRQPLLQPVCRFYRCRGTQHAARRSRLLRTAKDGIAALNARYRAKAATAFCSSIVPASGRKASRPGSAANETRQSWKNSTRFSAVNGSPEILVEGRLPAPIAFVITLDADTQLPIEAARRLVETIAHPSEPRRDRSRHTHARTRLLRHSAARQHRAARRHRHALHRVFADASGTDPYCRTVSDAQQDLFQEAIFHGKAIYDVQAFHAILKRPLSR